jgi:hypothetical protein
MDKVLARLENGKTIFYAHNLASFDGIFILKHLIKYGKVEPILNNGKIISITLTVKGESKKDIKTLVFKDSYLMLPSSLRKLCTAFNVNTIKTNFPYLLDNIGCRAASGVFPKFQYWTGIDKAEWRELKAQHGLRMWNFYQESIKYCEIDCISLHEIITKFSELFFNKFKINIHDSLTAPSLSMRLFRTHYMPKDTIYQILGNPYHNMRQSYTGGAVDVYIPHNKVTPLNPITKNNNILNLIVKDERGKYKVLYYYDVNSLYPYVMAYNEMPIGKPIEFLGDISRQRRE